MSDPTDRYNPSIRSSSALRSNAAARVSHPVTKTPLPKARVVNTIAATIGAANTMAANTMATPPKQIVSKRSENSRSPRRKNTGPTTDSFPGSRFGQPNQKNIKPSPVPSGRSPQVADRSSSVGGTDKAATGQKKQRVASTDDQTGNQAGPDLTKKSAIKNKAKKEARQAKHSSSSTTSGNLQLLKKSVLQTGVPRSTTIITTGAKP